MEHVLSLSVREASFPREGSVSLSVTLYKQLFPDTTAFPISELTVLILGWVLRAQSLHVVIDHAVIKLVRRYFQYNSEQQKLILSSDHHAVI